MLCHAACIDGRINGVHSCNCILITIASRVTVAVLPNPIVRIANVISGIVMIRIWCSFPHFTISPYASSSLVNVATIPVRANANTTHTSFFIASVTISPATSTLLLVPTVTVFVNVIMAKSSFSIARVTLSSSTSALLLVTTVAALVHVMKTDTLSSVAGITVSPSTSTLFCIATVAVVVYVVQTNISCCITISHATNILILVDTAAVVANAVEIHHFCSIARLHINPFSSSSSFVGIAVVFSNIVETKIISSIVRLSINPYTCSTFAGAATVFASVVEIILRSIVRLNILNITFSTSSTFLGVAAAYVAKTIIFSSIVRLPMNPCTLNTFVGATILANNTSMFCSIAYVTTSSITVSPSTSTLFCIATVAVVVHVVQTNISCCITISHATNILILVDTAAVVANAVEIHHFCSIARLHINPFSSSSSFVGIAVVFSNIVETKIISSIVRLSINPYTCSTFAGAATVFAYVVEIILRSIVRLNILNITFSTSSTFLSVATVAAYVAKTIISSSIVRLPMNPFTLNTFVGATILANNTSMFCSIAYVTTSSITVSPSTSTLICIATVAVVVYVVQTNISCCITISHATNILILVDTAAVVANAVEIHHFCSIARLHINPFSSSSSFVGIAVVFSNIVETKIVSSIVRLSINPYTCSTFAGAATVFAYVVEIILRSIVRLNILNITFSTSSTFLGVATVAAYVAKTIIFSSIARLPMNPFTLNTFVGATILANNTSMFCSIAYVTISSTFHSVPIILVMINVVQTNIYCSIADTGVQISPCIFVGVARVTLSSNLVEADSSV
ncbi:hypothetical protein AB1Y20_010046 [Prymnesium parvum]|uniref:Uncharacterized protein n=1 Tax=Prymnesium parvum TaxID=97485 RepID=A0AB34K609_PRYPA